MRGGFRIRKEQMSLKMDFYFQIDLLHRIDGLATIIQKKRKILNKVHDQRHSKVNNFGWYGNTQVVNTLDHLEIVEMADRFWKSMPAALKRPTLDELYRPLRDLDYTQVDERMAVMLNAILQLEEQGECRESATEAVLMVGYTTERISNQEQTRWLSWNVDGGVRNRPALNNNTEYGAGEFPLPTRPPARSAGQSTSKPPSMMRAQQTEETFPHLGSLKRELERTQRERNKANLDRDGAELERDQANLERDQAILEREQARRDLDNVKSRVQARTEGARE